MPMPIACQSSPADAATAALDFNSGMLTGQGAPNEAAAGTAEWQVANGSAAGVAADPAGRAAAAAGSETLPGFDAGSATASDGSVSRTSTPPPLQPDGSAVAPPAQVRQRIIALCIGRAVLTLTLAFKIHYMFMVFTIASLFCGLTIVRILLKCV